MGRRGIAGKTKTRVENLLAWMLAIGIVLLIVAGMYFVALQAGVI